MWRSILEHKIVNKIVFIVLVRKGSNSILSNYNLSELVVISYIVKIILFTELFETWYYFN